VSHVKLLTHNLPPRAGNPAGMCACGGTLYLADSLNGSLRVFHQGTMNESTRVVGAVSTLATTVVLACGSPLGATIDSGQVWLLQCFGGGVNCTTTLLDNGKPQVTVVVPDSTSGIAFDAPSKSLFAAAGGSGILVYDVGDAIFTAPPVVSVGTTNTDSGPFHSADTAITVVTTPVGTFGRLAHSSGGDLQGVAATFLNPTVISIDANGSVLVSHYRSWVRKLTLPGTASTASRPTSAAAWVGVAHNMALGWDRLSLAWMQTADTSRVNTSLVHTDQFMMEVDWDKATDSNVADSGFWRPLAYTMSDSLDDVRRNTSRNWTPFLRSINGTEFMYKTGS
jgi:hypothetical protein